MRPARSSRRVERPRRGLATVADALIRARAADVLDVTDRIARRLAGLPDDEELLPEPAIVVADDLAPSLTATLPRERLLGIALEQGSATAHAAILARAYGIPAVVGARGLLDALRGAGQDVELAIDGATGEIVIDARRRRSGPLRPARRRARAARARDLVEASLDAVTADGTRRDAARQHRRPGRGAGRGRARGPRGRPVPDRVPLP